jgi:hypothetical protein
LLNFKDTAGSLLVNSADYSPAKSSAAYGRLKIGIAVDNPKPPTKVT